MSNTPADYIEKALGVELMDWQRSLINDAQAATVRKAIEDAREADELLERGRTWGGYHRSRSG